MMNILMITWTFVAACASFVIGAWMTFSAHGERWPGVVLMLGAALVGGLGVQLCRERLNRVRPRAVVRDEGVQPARVQRQRPVAAVPQKRQPSRRATAATTKSGKTQAFVLGKQWSLPDRYTPSGLERE